MVAFSFTVLQSQTNIPYSLKFLRTKSFVDFVVFGAPTKILCMKISHLAVVA